jgi:glutamyl/glutaminyl-tRNA synthetase
MSTEPIVRTRFAPSPSGHLHVGGARTALFNWAFARAHGGRFLLRIEDTDRKRSSDAASMAFLEDLKWLGIEWDEGPEHEGCGGGEAGPYFASERREIYDGYLDRLLEEGQAYPAFETPEELQAARAKARAEKVDYRYDRAALDLDPDTVRTWIAEGRPHVIRLKVPDEALGCFDDRVLGLQEMDRSRLDDFVIRKADGFPTYHFAVVVDDELMGVTHVLRAQEHLANTPKHIVLQRVLGFRTPVYAHMPLILNIDGSKMSKRDKDKALRAAVEQRGLEGAEAVDLETWTWWLAKKEHQLDLDVAERLAAELGVDLPEIDVVDFHRSGYRPEVLVNFLALLGWSPGDDVEKFDRDFLVERFDLDRVNKGAAKFDRDKLLAFSLDALQAMSDEAFAAAFREHCEAFHPALVDGLSPEAFDLLARANKARSKTLETTVASSLFFVTPDEEIVYTLTKPVKKALLAGETCGYDHLAALAPKLEGLEARASRPSRTATCTSGTPRHLPQLRLAEEFGGKCNLRFDDTNPRRKSRSTSIRSRRTSAGSASTGGPALYASDYFEQLYDWAVELIKKGKAYV